MKSNYQPPHVEIIEMQNEGSIMTGSGLPQMGGQDFIDNTSRSAGASSGQTHQAAGPMQDLEDMLNDLFTVRK